MSQLRLRLVAAAASLVALVGAGGANATSSELFFSEYIEGSSNNKALEIYNGTGGAINLATAGYSVQMFFNGSSSAGLTINLTGTVAAGDVYVLAQSSASATILAQADQTNGAGWFNGDDAVVLRKGTTVVDAIGQVGFDPGTEWGTGLASTADNTLRRKIAITAGDTNSGDAFDPSLEWDGFATDTFNGLGGHGGAAGVSVDCGGPLTLIEGGTATRTITARDEDGRVTNIEITSIAPAPASGSITLGPVTPASSFGGTASATLTASGLPAGSYTVGIGATNNDAPTPQVGSCTLQVGATAIKTIGEVQGSVGPTAIGGLHRSPFAPPSGNGAGQTVVVQGVIYEKSLQRTSAGANQYGFFIQNTAAQADGDPTTSNGLFVFMGAFSDVLPSQSGAPNYVPKVGDEIVISGRASEFFNLTQLSSPRFERLVATALDVDAVLPPVEVDPSSLLDEANREWERLEDMRVEVPAGALVTDGLDSFPGTADTEAWLVRGDSEIAQRTTPYERRVFRDAHPLDDLPGLVDNGNGFRILLGPNGLKALAGDNRTLLPPSRTFDTVSNRLVGAVNYSFNKYRIETTVAPELVNGVDPSLNNPPTAGDRHVEYGIGDYNVENLYDYRDDLNDGCDFPGNAGCPGVNPPFDYVPASDAVYQERLGLMAQQIVNDLHAPDVLLIQEAEDQDICWVAGGSLACGTADNADGKPDTLQELALRIASSGGPAYDAAFDRDGSDDRGIVAALMYRTDRVQLLPATAAHPVLGSNPQVQYRVAGNAYNSQVQNPKALNAPLPADVDRSSGVDGTQVYTRDPQVGYFRIWRTAVGVGAWTDVYAISNHFSSTPDARRGQRREQAAYLAAIVDALADGTRVVAGGDFNVFPRPDDPVQPPSDQLGPLYEQGLSNLWDTMVAENPASAYSYVFVGMAQTLDGQFVTPTLLDELQQTRVAHVNADFAADYPGDGARGLSDHDPMASRFAIPTTLSGLEALLAYYRDTGAISGKNTYDQLQHHLEQAKQVGDTQLQAFIDQVRDKTPKFVTQTASDALIDEAELLLQS